MSGSVRHEFLDQWCSALSRVALGHKAAEVLEAGHIPDRAALVMLPTWAWMHAARNIGRKDVIRGSSARYEMPVRVAWHPSPVLLVSYRHPVTASWTAEGLGHSLRGQVTIRACATTGVAPLRIDDGRTPEGEFTAPLLSARAIEHHLRECVRDGKAALWEAIELISPAVERLLNRAHSYLSADVARVAAGPSDLAPFLLDTESLKTLQDKLLLGEDGPLEHSPVGAAIVASLEPSATIRVDPLRYVTVAIRRSAQLVIRSAVGDVPLGSKIRTVAAEIDGFDPAEVVAQYRQRWPRDRVGVSRVTQALSVQPSPDATALSLDSLGSRPCEEAV